MTAALPRIVNPPELASTYVDVKALAWQDSGFPGIEHKVLYHDDSGRSTILFKMAPGAVVPAHEHTDVEQTYILSGTFQDDEGIAVAGQFVWRPAGNRHVAHTPDGAVILSVFGKPNRFDTERKFFTEM